MRSSDIYFAILVCGILLAGVPRAEAQSVKYVTPSPKSVRITYDSALEQSATITATLSIEKGSTEMDYYVTFDPAPASRLLTNGVDFLPFAIYDTAQLPRNELLDDVSAMAPADVLTGTFPTPAKNRAPTDERSFVVVFPPGGFVPSGTYTADAVATLWSGPFKNGVYKGEAALPLTVTVRDIMDVAIVPVGGSFDFAATQVVMDYGYLTAGTKKSVDLLARANTTFGLALTSANAGVLKNTDPLDTSTIAYQFAIDNTAVNLSAGTSVPITTLASPTTAEGIRFRLDATILAFDFPSEGEYSDILTFTISKN
jgi:hypothetical protein